MALPSSGPLSASMISNEIGFGSTPSSFSVYNLENLNLIDLNALSISSSNQIPNLSGPTTMSEWYNYNHSQTPPFADSLLSVGLFGPSSSYYRSTFMQVDLGTSNGTASFTGSNFTLSGAAGTLYVSYSIYQTAYSTLFVGNYCPLIQIGVITPSAPSASFNYTYNPLSGSIVTILFREYTLCDCSPC